jgi:hypothetical protein
MLPSIGEGFGCSILTRLETHGGGEGVTQPGLIGLDKLDEVVDPCLVGLQAVSIADAW